MVVAWYPPTEKEDILLAGKSDLLEQQNPDLDNDDIDLLDIADGLKELLRKNKFTIDKLLTMSSSELTDVLGIDVYVVKIIVESAKKISFLRWYVKELDPEPPSDSILNEIQEGDKLLFFYFRNQEIFWKKDWTNWSKGRWNGGWVWVMLR